MSEQLTPLTFDEWGHLLAPLSPEAPTGKYLCYEETYDKIREARREDDPNLPRNEWDKNLKKADWSQVHDLCLEALTNHTKDLQIAVWLTEALLHLSGYRGLKAGLQLIIQLSESYWEALFPPIEDGDMGLRISPLEWLNHDKFTLQLGTVAITAPATGDTVPYTFIDRENAKLLEKMPQAQKEAAAAEGKPTQTQFLTSVTLTPSSFYTRLVADLQEAIDAVDKLNKMLDEYCTAQAPGLGKFRQTLLDIQHVVNVILVDKSQVSPAKKATEINKDDASSVTDETESTGPNLNTGPIRSRSEAYQRLAEAAEYLEKTEPHSPTPYLVKRAIAWGNMPLSKLLSELVNDERDLVAIYTLLGIKDKSGKK